MIDGIKMVNEMAKAWIIKVTKKCMVSIFAEPTMNLDVTESGNPEDMRTRLMRLRVRVKGFL
jgi:hypothetical protein